VGWADNSKAETGGSKWLEETIGLLQVKIECVSCSVCTLYNTD